jgi:penicillin-insensitive murein endopeptidase
MRLPIASLAVLGTTLALSASAMSGSTTHHAATARVTSPALASLRYGRSVGSPTDGHLIGGTHLDETGYLRVEPADAPGDVRWGVGPLVDMIDRSARSVRRQYPDAITSVGHLSREGGGDIDQHRSHESGRDADVGFFVRSSTGKELLSSHFVAFRGDGTAPTCSA